MTKHEVAAELEKLMKNIEVMDENKGEGQDVGPLLIELFALAGYELQSHQLGIRGTVLIAIEKS